MAIDVHVPPLGESVTEGVIVRWLKADGDEVKVDEPLLELETEKAAMEIVAEAAGRLQIVQPAGARVPVGAVVARIAEQREGAAAPAATREQAPALSAHREAAPPPLDLEPGVRAAPASRAPAAPTDATDTDVERSPMSELRRTIAARLVQAQQTAAILTTFNEVDLGDLLALRARHRERFRSRHGVDLGLVSLFGRATVLALGEFPVLNARIDGNDIVHHRRVHLGIAVSTPRGLVVPVIRRADGMTLAELERAIDALAGRAREGKLVPDDLSGGTFTITNGGVFGSLLSTPLLNPPQSGILGMHKIEERPVAVDGRVVIRPMMYVALSYDHRLVDGEQAVRFLVRLKELLEEPARMVLEV